MIIVMENLSIKKRRERKNKKGEWLIKGQES